MRTIGLISITLATIALTTTDVGGAGNRWCAIYTQRNCTFATFEQCRAQVLGLGGWCQPNPFPDTALIAVCVGCGNGVRGAGGEQGVLQPSGPKRRS